MRALLLAPLLTVIVLGQVNAQVPTTMPPVDSGLVVRAWLDSGQLRGRLLMTMRATDDSVRYCRFPGPPCDERGARGEPAWLALDGVRHLDVQVGTRWQKGAWIGGAAGTVVGVLLGSIAVGMCERDCPTQATGAIVGGAFGAVFHGALGALIGSAFPRFERRF